jgi:hypothetical protein
MRAEAVDPKGNLVRDEAGGVTSGWSVDGR